MDEVDTMAESSTNYEESYHRNEEEDHESLLVKETIEEGRGDRDDVGIRDQWSSDEHLRQSYDSRRPPSGRVLRLLEKYRLKCEGCDHESAVAKVNAFVQDTKVQAAKQKKLQEQKEQVAKGSFMLLLVILGAAFVWYRRKFPDSFVFQRGSQKVGDGTSGLGQARRLEIERQRQRAAEREAQAKAAWKEPPSWREVEEKEFWSDEQELQFARALKSFGGVPAKARYTLIADKVDGKTRHECLMHHKLLQVLEKEKKGS